MKKILTFFSQTQISIVVGTCGENFGPLPCPMAILGAQKVSGRIPPGNCQPPYHPGLIGLRYFATIIRCDKMICEKTKIKLVLFKMR